jgi:hypothetical protein
MLFQRFSGFPKGIAEALVIKAFRRFESDHAVPTPCKDAFSNAQRLQARTIDESFESESLRSSCTVSHFDCKVDQTPSEHTSVRKSGILCDTSSFGCEEKSVLEEDVIRKQATHQLEHQRQDKSNRIQESSPVTPDDQKRSAPARHQDSGFVPYNGGSGHGYRWSQTLDELTLCVDLLFDAGSAQTMLMRRMKHT